MSKVNKKNSSHWPQFWRETHAGIEKTDECLEISWKKKWNLSLSHITVLTTFTIFLSLLSTTKKRTFMCERPRYKHSSQVDFFSHFVLHSRSSAYRNQVRTIYDNVSLTFFLNYDIKYSKNCDLVCIYLLNMCVSFTKISIFNFFFFFPK